MDAPRRNGMDLSPLFDSYNQPIPSTEWERVREQLEPFVGLKCFHCGEYSVLSNTDFTKNHYPQAVRFLPSQNKLEDSRPVNLTSLQISESGRRIYNALQVSKPNKKFQLIPKLNSSTWSRKDIGEFRIANISAWDRIDWGCDWPNWIEWDMSNLDFSHQVLAEMVKPWVQQLYRIWWWWEIRHLLFYLQGNFTETKTYQISKYFYSTHKMSNIPYPTSPFTDPDRFFPFILVPF